MTGPLLVGGLDLEVEFPSLFVTRLPDVLHHAAAVLAPVLVPGLAGGYSAGPARVDPREFTIGFGVQGTVDEARTLCRHLRSLVGSDLVAVQTSDVADLLIYARLREATPTALAPEAISDTVLGELVFEAEHPYWREVHVQEYGFAGTPVALPQGNAPTAPEYELWGPATTPTLEILHANGMVWASATFGITLGTDDRLRIVTAADTMTIAKKLGAAAWATDPSLLSAGLFPGSLDPHALGNPRLGHYPFARVTAVSGTPAGLARYPRQFV